MVKKSLNKRENRKLRRAMECLDAVYKLVATIYALIQIIKSFF